MESLAIIIDARVLNHYPFARSGFSGGTEQYIHRLAHGLAERGNLVHVVASDLDHEEMRGDRLFYWGPENFPRACDVLIPVCNAMPLQDYPRLAPIVVLASNGVDPELLDYAPTISGIACFSQTHVGLLRKMRPEVTAEQCFVTGLGVDLDEYARLAGVEPAAKSFGDSRSTEPQPRPNHTVHGRMLYGNDPTRGLWHVLDVFDAVKKRVPEATLHVTYDFERQFGNVRWMSHAVAELMWDCKRRIETTPGITSLGALSHEDLLREQTETHVYAYPSDPMNVGSQIHGLLQMELAAAGVPLVLSDVEAFPEIFGSCADGGPAARILPLPNSMARGDGDSLERFSADDWAEVVVELMTDQKAYAAASKGSRKLAEQHTWPAMLDRWAAMLERLVERLQGEQPEVA